MNGVSLPCVGMSLWYVIRNLCYLLLSNPIKVTATRNAILGKEDVATSNWVIPTMHEVKEEWENFLADEEYAIIAPAIQAGLNNMYKWYRKITEDTPVYFICHGKSHTLACVPLESRLTNQLLSA
jgi:hypothetical protein